MTTASGRIRNLGPGLRVAALAALGLLCWPGCATKKSLTITRDPYINNGMHVDRQMGDRTGEPLEVAVVMVYPNDLKNDANMRLRPDSGMNVAEWFEKRPQPGDDPAATGGNPRFRLKQSQIYLFTNDTQYYGTRIGPAINGSATDKGDPKVRELDFKEGMNDPNAAIYVFARFNSPGTNATLPAPPVVFRKPGSYPKDLTVHVGVDWNRTATNGQYLEARTASK